MDHETNKLVQEIATQAVGGMMANPAYFSHTPERITEDAVRIAVATVKELRDARFRKEK